MNFPSYVEALSTFLEAAKAKFSRVDSWGSVGLCWGGKVVALLSDPQTAFKATAQVHPGYAPSHFMFLLYLCFLASEKLAVY